MPPFTWEGKKEFINILWTIFRKMYRKLVTWGPPRKGTKSWLEEKMEERLTFLF